MKNIFWVLVTIVGFHFQANAQSGLQLEWAGPRANAPDHGFAPLKPAEFLQAGIDANADGINDLVTWEQASGQLIITSGADRTTTWYFPVPPEISADKNRFAFHGFFKILENAATPGMKQLILGKRNGRKIVSSVVIADTGVVKQFSETDVLMALDDYDNDGFVEILNGNRENGRIEIWGDTTTPLDTSFCSESNPQACLYPIDLEYDFDITQEQLVDSSRVGGPREIRIAIYRPIGAVEPLPVVILSHGGSSGKTNPLKSLPEWAAPIAKAGFLAVAIAHLPVSQAQRDSVCEYLGGTTPADCDSIKMLNWHRPYDVRFVLDWLEQQQQSGPLAGKLDLQRIAHLGHSAGAGASMMLAGAARIYLTDPVVIDDPRIKAFLAFSPQGPGDDGFFDDSWANITRPVLVGTGDGDNTGGAVGTNRRKAYDLMLPGEKYLLYIQDEAAKHVSFSLNPKSCERVASTGRCHLFSKWLLSAALAFLDAQLLQEPQAYRWLNSDRLGEASNGVVEWDVR